MTSIVEQLIFTDEEARESMAHLIASVVSGIRGALPEQIDYDLADIVLAQIESVYSA